MKALIQNSRVIQVSETTFEVHPSLIWIDSPEGCEYGWEVVNGVPQAPSGPTDEEVADGVRSMRDALLAETDWVVVFHTEKGTNIPLEWEVYRQALRDITTQGGFPHDVVRPTKPE